MNKICTTIEESKKLIELGIDVNTADMYYGYDYNSPVGGYEEDAQIIPQSEFNEHFVLFPEDIPAWSLAALSELMPLINEYNVEYRPIIERYKDDGWACKYYNEETRSTDDVYIRRYGRTPLDAAFDMVVWLKENNKL